MPFIIVGNYQSLKFLKSIGYKTFDQWWDESYDEEPNPMKRLKKIEQIILYISTLEKSDLIRIYSEMKPILESNYKQLKSTNSGKSFALNLINNYNKLK
jgi:hypothetical protein